MVMTPWDWQTADINTLRNNNYTGLLNIEPGGTKTAISTWAIAESGADTKLIVAPLNTHKSAWKKTVQNLLGEEVRRIGNSLKADRVAMTDFEMGYPGWYIITPQLLTRQDPTDWRVDATIVDEIHMINAPRKPGQTKLQMLGERSGMRLGLSGTPSRRAFERNWSNARFLWPELRYRGDVGHDNYMVWLADRMTHEDIVTGFEWKKCSKKFYDEFVEKRRYGVQPQGEYVKIKNNVLLHGRPKTAKKWLNESEPGRLYEEMPCVLQHFRREQCCEFHPEGFLDLEEPQVINIEVPLHAKQKKAITGLENEYLAWLDHRPLVVDLTITQKQRIRQVCLGVPTLEEAYDEETDEVQTLVDFDVDCVSPFADEVESILTKLGDEPVVVYLESQKFAQVLTQRLNKNGWSAAEFSGKTVKEREGFLDRFGKDIQVIVGTITAIGTGTDGIQAISNTEIWIERSVDDTANDQCESRQDRLGVKGRVQRFVISDDMGYADGMMDAQLTKRIAINQSNRKQVN